MLQASRNVSRSTLNQVRGEHHEWLSQADYHSIALTLPGRLYMGRLKPSVSPKGGIYAIHTQYYWIFSNHLFNFTFYLFCLKFTSYFKLFRSTLLGLQPIILSSQIELILFRFSFLKIHQILIYRIWFQFYDLPDKLIICLLSNILGSAKC